MKLSNRIYTAIGFAMKAGKCASGEFAVEKAYKSRKVKILLLDAGVSENSFNRWSEECKKHNIPLLKVENLGQSIGKDNRMVAAITGESFTKMIMDELERIKNEDNGGIE